MESFVRSPFLALCTSTLLGMAAVATPAVAADNYPSRAVRIVVPYAAGGTVDLVARVLAQQLSEQTKQNFFVDNRPGASGVIGNEAVAQAAPDGYTLLVQSPTMIANPLILKSTPYNVAKDFTPVSLLGTVPMLVLSNPSVPAANLSEFIKVVKADPRKHAFGTSAAGSPMHLAQEAIKSQGALDVPIVVYKGTAGALNDAVGGQVTMLVDAVPSSSGFVAAGKLKPLAVTTATRLPSYPDVPTVAESGVPGFDMASWYGLWAPARIPADVQARLNAEVAKAMKSDAVRTRLAPQAFVPVGNSSADFSAFVNKETENYAAIIKKANIKLE